MPSIPSTRILFFFASIITLAAWSCSKAKNSSDTHDSRPNIVMIMSDDHTSQAWGIYGGVLQQYVRNDHIKRLQTEGVLLQHLFCTNSICVPSRGAILTGQYSHQNHIYTLNDALHPDSNHIAKTLHQNGYQTAIIGKWHLKKEPSGFDHYMVLPGQGRYHDPLLKVKGQEPWQDGGAGGTIYPGFSADVIGDQSVKWLSQRKDKTQPFLLMTHFKATHEPFDYPARHRDLFQDMEIEEPASLYDTGPTTNQRSFIGQSLDVLYQRYHADAQRPTDQRRYPWNESLLESKDSIQIRKWTYQKFIKDFLRSGAAINDNIGKILKYLDDSGLSHNTIVIYTADQGYFLGEHGFFDKRMIYEEALRIPFVLRYPNEVPAGQERSELIMNIDIPSLLADYAQVESADYLQGRSFRRILKGEQIEDWRDAIYYRYWQHLPERPAHLGIRTERYKLAFFYGQPLDMKGASTTATPPAWELYDLFEDPQELHNVYEDPQYHDIVSDLRDRLLDERTRIGDTDSANPLIRDLLQDLNR